MSSLFLHGIGAVCLVFCGWCVGDGVCIRAEAHRQALQKTIALLERIRREIEFRRTDLRALLCAMQREGLVGQAEHSLQTLAPDPALTRRVWAVQKQRRNASSLHFTFSSSRRFRQSLHRSCGKRTSFRISLALRWGWRLQFC